MRSTEVEELSDTLKVVPFSSFRSRPGIERVDDPLADAFADCDTVKPRSGPLTTRVTPPAADPAVLVTPPKVLVAVFATLPTVLVTPPSNPPPEEAPAEELDEVAVEAHMSSLDADALVVV